MMTSQILKFGGFTKTQSNKKIHQLYIKGYFMAKNSFAAEVTFKEMSN